MPLSSYGRTQVVGRAREKRLSGYEALPSVSPTSWVLSHPSKCIHNLTDNQLKHGPFLLEHCHCHFIQYFKKNTRKLIKCIILLNRSERFVGWMQACNLIDWHGCASIEIYGPRPHVAGYFRKRMFFSPYLKKSASTRSVFESYLAVHT